MRGMVEDLRGRGVVVGVDTLGGILRMQCGASLRLLGRGRNSEEIRPELYYVPGWQYQRRAGDRWALQCFVDGARVGRRMLGRPWDLADWLEREVGCGMWGDMILGDIMSRWEDCHGRVFRVWQLESLEEARVAWGRLEEQVRMREEHLRILMAVA